MFRFFSVMILIIVAIKGINFFLDKFNLLKDEEDQTKKEIIIQRQMDDAEDAMRIKRLELINANISALVDDKYVSEKELKEELNSIQKKLDRIKKLKNL